MYLTHLVERETIMYDRIAHDLIDMGGTKFQACCVDGRVVHLYYGSDGSMPGALDVQNIDNQVMFAQFARMAVHPLDMAFPAPAGTLSLDEYRSRRIAMALHPSALRRDSMADALCWDGVNGYLS